MSALQQFAGIDNPAAASMQQSIGASEQDQSAIDRAVQSGNSEPHMVIEQALRYLKDPSNGLGKEMNMSLVEPLLQAKHLGPDGKGGFASGAQGGVDIGEGRLNHGVLGFFNKVVGGQNAYSKIGTLNNSSAGITAGGTGEGAGLAGAGEGASMSDAALLA